MNTNIKFHIWQVLPIIIFFIILSFSGCNGPSSVKGQLDIAESLMENRPDSSLSILEAIPTSDLYKKDQKARYALLKSMALDKNYVDTTTFDVLQPAIDYYLEKGTPDEKLRTYYYQGRVYQNRNDRDSALYSFMKGLDIADISNDSLTIARTLVAQGIIYKSFYDIDGYISNFLRAADIYRYKNKKDYEFDCLLSALNGLNILSNKEQSDSVLEILTKFDSLNHEQKLSLHILRISYIINFGSEQELNDQIKNNMVGMKSNANSILNLALAYRRLGDHVNAIQQLDYLDSLAINYDTLRYTSIRYLILNDANDYKGALDAYKDFSHRCEVINASKFEQKNHSMKEKHQMELQAERDAERSKMIIWGCIGGLVFLAMSSIILMLLMHRSKAKKDVAIQKARNTQLENDNLKAEREVLTLENRNLQLERDNKILEAENLAHRVKTLEEESEDLKELLQSKEEMPDEVRKAIQTRIEMLNSYLASQISDHKEFEKAYDEWVAELTANKEQFMDTNRLALQASHPKFIRYFEDHGLTTAEINYVCLYAIGLRGKDVGNYMKMRSHVNISSTIRKKLGIDKHETNIGIYVRRLLSNL